MALISREIIDKIERELYDYPINLQVINAQRDDIINGSHYPEVSVSGGELSNQTESKGLRMAGLDTAWVDLVSVALSRMPGEYKAITRGVYFEHKRVPQVALELHISQSLGYAWRDNLFFYLTLMATQRGLIHPFD